MTELYGFRCNECGVESPDKQGPWFEVKTAPVRHEHGARGMGVRHWWSEGSHYCSKECLVAAFGKAKP